MERHQFQWVNPLFLWEFPPEGIRPERTPAAIVAKARPNALGRNGHELMGRSGKTMEKHGKTMDTYHLVDLQGDQQNSENQILNFEKNLGVGTVTFFGGGKS